MNDDRLNVFPVTKSARNTPDDIPAPVAFLAVGATPPARFQAPGIDIGYFN